MPIDFETANEETRIMILESQVAILIDNGYEQSRVLTDIANLDKRIKKLESEMEVLRKYVSGLLSNNV